MKGEAIRPLAERWQTGVRLLHTSATAVDASEATAFVVREIEWTAGALEDAAPWLALQARLEPLGELKAAEELILIGMRAQSVEHAWSLICLAVRLHRIATWLDAMATVPVGKKTGPKSGPTPESMCQHIALGRALYGDGQTISLTEAGRQAVAKLRKGYCKNDVAAVQYVRKHISELPAR